jgi:hypothetical protein
MSDIADYAVDLDAALQYVDQQWRVNRRPGSMSMKDYDKFKRWNALAVKVHRYLSDAQAGNAPFKQWNALAIQTHMLIGMVRDLADPKSSGVSSDSKFLQWEALVPILHKYALLAHEKLADPHATDFKTWNALAQQTLRYLGVAVEPVFADGFKNWAEMEELLTTYLELVHAKLAETNSKKSTIRASDFQTGIVEGVYPSQEQSAVLIKAFHRISQYIDRQRGLQPIFTPGWWNSEEDFRDMNKVREALADAYKDAAPLAEQQATSSSTTTPLPEPSTSTKFAFGAPAKKETASPFLTFILPPAKAKMPAWA